MGINQYIKIGTRIKEARLAKQIPQKEMAKRLSLSASKIGRASCRERV